MAFDFGSDILVDALRAADPAGAAEARQKLERISVQAELEKNGAPNFSASLTRFQKKPPLSDQSAKVAEKFEAAVLTTFVQEMMPKNAAMFMEKDWQEICGSPRWQKKLLTRLLRVVESE